MVDVSNNVNNKINKPHLGVIPVPNALHRPKLFNHKEAHDKYSKMATEIREDKEKVSYEKTLSTPIGIKILGGVGIAAILISIAKKIITKKT